MKLVPMLDGSQELVEEMAGLLLICNGCCCGSGHGSPRLEKVHYLREARRRGIDSMVDIVFTADDGGGCLGVCSLGNTVFLYLFGRGLWFQAINTREDIDALYDYVEESIRAGEPVLPKGPLAERVYTKVQGELVPVGARS
jgi:(2Fe-2S) ferredoxin